MQTSVTVNLHGMFRDVLRDQDGRVTWKSDWVENVIVTDCRRLLAGFMHGAPTGALGLQGMQVGAGSHLWDAMDNPPNPDPTQVALVDAHPFTLPLANMQMSYLVGSTVSATPTDRLQVFATLGPGVPPWPDDHHHISTLREFGLVAQLDGVPLLVNYRTHAAIPKDPFSTLERTIWLTF